MKYWTPRELRTLRTHFPRGGVAACTSRLPDRTPLAIAAQAFALKLKAPARTSNPAQIYKSTPEIDELITDIYTSRPVPGAVQALADRLDVPRWWISQQATRLCVVPVRIKEPAWADDELRLALSLASKHPATIQRALRAAGHKRSLVGILVKLKRHGATGRNADPDNYSATALAKLFGIDGHAVMRWIEDKLLRGRRRGTKRTKLQGGDEYVVHWSAVRAFVIANPHLVDFRKVDKCWFIETLTREAK